MARRLSVPPLPRSGKYELQGVLTHKGRSADSGHYVSWVKQKDATWTCYDDDKLVRRRESPPPYAMLARRRGGEGQGRAVPMTCRLAPGGAGRAALAAADVFGT